jgi:hypothetical protein
MNMNYYFSKEELSKITKLYLGGMSAQEIKEMLHLPHTVRSIQRRVKQAGIVRTVGDSFRNAVARGRVKWAYKENKKHRTHLSPKLRYLILTRDEFKCLTCGATAQTSNLEIDHINNNPSDNREENLQTLCHDCNFGRPRD